LPANFWIDLNEKMFVVTMTQEARHAGTIAYLVRDLVYEALAD
jgi:hypothetical protein